MAATPSPWTMAHHGVSTPRFTAAGSLRSGYATIRRSFATARIRSVLSPSVMSILRGRSRPFTARLSLVDGADPGGTAVEGAANRLERGWDAVVPLVLDRHDLTDAEWLLQLLLPDRTPRRGGRWADHRQVLNGVFWRTRCGVPWRDLPPQFGTEDRLHRYRRWSGDGTWERILVELRRAADAEEGTAWTVAVDSWAVRAHQHAAGARHSAPVDVPAEVVAPLELDTGGGVESQGSARSARSARSRGVGPVPGWPDHQDSSGR